MHELGIAGEILSAALAEAGRHGAARVLSVTVRVGVLRGIVPDHLRFLFGHMARGTIAEGAVLAIEDEPVRVACPACGTIASGSIVLSCPACGREEIRLDGGDALSVVSLDIDV